MSFPLHIDLQVPILLADQAQELTGAISLLAKHDAEVTHLRISLEATQTFLPRPLPPLGELEQAWELPLKAGESRAFPFALPIRRPAPSRLSVEKQDRSHRLSRQIHLDSLQFHWRVWVYVADGRVAEAQKGVRFQVR
jgi:hypothetical protein